MKIDGSTAPPTAWTRQRERSNRWQLRAMRWLATALGRRAARLLLHPIVCAFILDAADAAPLGALSGARARPHGNLGRRLPPPAHVRGHGARSRLPAAGAVRGIPVRGERRRGDHGTVREGRRRARVRRPSGQLRSAAHDRPRAGAARGDDHVRGQRAPPQRDARRARAACRAANDRARPRRRDARDPAVARRGRRRRPARRPHPARQLAAIEGDRRAVPRRAGPLSRRPVPPRRDAAPARRLHGGALPRRRATTTCASSSSPTSAASSAAGRQRQPSATPRSAPRSSATWPRSNRSAAKRHTTGSTSTISGPMPSRRPNLAHRVERRRFVAAALAVACGGAGALGAAPARAAGFDLEALTALLGRVSSGEATFVETRRVLMLDRTLKSSGRLSFKAPDVFVRETLRPRHETARRRRQHADHGPRRSHADDAARRLARSGGHRRGDPRHAHRQPRRRSSGCSRAGSRASRAQWSLELVPRDLRLRGQVASVRVSGKRGGRAGGPGAARRRRSLGDDDRAGRQRARRLVSGLSR